MKVQGPIKSRELNTYLLQIFENVIVQDLLPIGAVEPLHERILGGLPRFDEFQMNPMALGPLCHRQRDKFGAVVHSDLFRIATPRSDLIEHPDNSGCRQVCIDFYTKRLSIEIVQDIECSEGPAVCEAVTHEIHRPTLIHLPWNAERHRISRRQPLFALAFEIQPELAVDSMNSFVVPGITGLSDLLKDLGKTVTQIFSRKTANSLDYRQIALRIRFVEVD